jgi:hypothetical protein
LPSNENSLDQYCQKEIKVNQICNLKFSGSHNRVYYILWYSICDTL